jgi:hypothetical protein
MACEEEGHNIPSYESLFQTIVSAKGEMLTHFSCMVLVEHESIRSMKARAGSKMRIFAPVYQNIFQNFDCIF